MAEVDFFFAFFSPYTCLACTQLDDLGARTGELRPFRENW